jgi:hypothetical protein
MNQPATTAGAGGYDPRNGFTGRDVVSPVAPGRAAVAPVAAGRAVEQVQQTGLVSGMAQDDWERLKQEFNTRPRDEQERFLQVLSRDYKGEGEAIGREEQLADELRGKEPGMRDAGAFTVAASPLEFLGKMGGDYMSQKRSNEAAGKRAALSASREEGVTGLLTARLRGGGGYGPEA